MRVTGSHLAAACKLVFKIARNDHNDHFFMDTNLLGQLYVFVLFMNNFTIKSINFFSEA